MKNKAITFLMTALLMLPVVSGAHLDSDFKNDENLRKIALSGPFGVDPIGQFYNVEAFFHGEGQVIRSRPYFQSQYLGYNAYPYYSDYYPYGCYGCDYYYQPYGYDLYDVHYFKGFSNEIILNQDGCDTYKFDRGFSSFTSDDCRSSATRYHYIY